MDLRTSVVMRLAAVATATAVAIGCSFVALAARQHREELATAARLAARRIDLQHLIQRRGAELQPLFDDLALPGLCLAQVDRLGNTARRECLGTAEGEPRSPVWFAAAVRAALPLETPAIVGLSERNTPYGRVEATLDGTAEIQRLWQESHAVLEMLAAEVLLVCGLAWFTVSAALRPAAQMLAQLARLADGDLAVRLPPARFAELHAISAAVNQLTVRLQHTQAERSELARRLVDAHETERRNLARELHDEFAQCLAAINARAAAIAQEAGPSSPTLAVQAQGIGSIASATLAQLRGTLTRLRPPEIDELGLVQSLRRAGARWAQESGVACSCEVVGRFDDLPMSIGVSLYRIAQECLTNVARHAGASRVLVTLTRPAALWVELAVVDDGRGAAPEAANPGLGWVGMRERAAALGATLTMEPAVPQGWAVRVRVRVPLAGSEGVA